MTPDLTYGGSGDLVLHVTNFLTRLNLLKSESQIFDATVEAAVKEFQQARGLTVTGVVDAITLRSLDEARWKLGDRVLSFGTPAMRGDDVAALQSQLSEMGFNCGRVDGIFGQDTEGSKRGRKVASRGNAMKHLVFAIAGASLLLAAAPAMADTTLDEVIAHGVTLDVAGMSFEITYKPDGTFSAGDRRHQTGGSDHGRLHLRPAGDDCPENLTA